MRYTAIFIFSAIISACKFASSTNSALLDAATLQSYSYLVFGVKFDEPVNGMHPFHKKQGTCFFVRKNGKVFLVSAKHVFVPGESAQEKKEFPEKLILRLFDKQGKPVAYEMNVQQLHKELRLGHFYQDPDVIAFELPDADAYTLLSIEDFMQKIPDTSFSEIVSFGFPNLDPPGKLSDFDTLMAQRPVRTIGKVLTKSQYPVNLEKEYYSDTINNIFLRKDSLPKQGCSGSPIFINNGQQWQFGGILTRAGTDNPFTVAVKPHYLYKALERLQ